MGDPPRSSVDDRNPTREHPQSEHSHALVEKFIAKAVGRGDDGGDSPESFARAITLDTLFADDRKFEPLVMLVNLPLADVDDALALRADEQQQATWSETLQTGEECCAILERCAELLCKALSEDVERGRYACQARWNTEHGRRRVRGDQWEQQVGRGASSGHFQANSPTIGRLAARVATGPRWI